MPHILYSGATRPVDPSDSERDTGSFVQPAWNTPSIEGAILLDDGRLAIGKSRLVEKGQVSGLSIGHVLDLPGNLLVRGDLVVTGSTTPPHRIEMDVVVEGNVIVRGRGCSTPRMVEGHPTGTDPNTEARSSRHGALVVVHGDLDCREADDPDLSLFDVRGTILLSPTSIQVDPARAESYLT